ncbi:MAG: type II toxin-antitoxin system RelB/DinJ family antitoxin [Selenomonadaceae bacterium]|nr:type II toxin-antitoxin system RelB/DinJ family antitoxin [Selenomonadaceae bacterium]
MATFQMTLDDGFKKKVDDLFKSLGMDTETAVRYLFHVSLERQELPFSIKNPNIPDDLLEAIRDVREHRNLYGPFDTAEEAVASMLKDD